MSKRPQRPLTVDEQWELQWQVNELGMWIDNTFELYMKKMARFKNMWGKYKKGIFDPKKAEKGFANLTDEAARDYNNQKFGAEYKIGMQARRIVDKEFVKEFMAVAKNREYGFMR